MERRKSRKIKLGNTTLGGDSPVLVQSMLNVPSTNIDGSVAQAKALAAAGCQVIRFAIPDEAALDLIEPIKNAVDVPPTLFSASALPCFMMSSTSELA